METKSCSKCFKVKTVLDFQKDKGQKSGLACCCRDCKNLVSKKYRDNNKKKISEWHKIDRRKNPQKYRERTKRYYNENRDMILEKAKTSIKHKEFCKKYRILHKHEINKKTNIRRTIRFATEPEYKLKHILRSRLKNALIGVGKKSKRTLELLGCSVEELKQHLESKFTDGMRWDNYGFYGWHIDHIKPCSKFNLTDPKQQEQCFHYSNLQPLWAKDNFSKYNK